MKSKPEITQRVLELKKVKPTDDYEVAYLALALEKDELELWRLFRRYKFELQEDEAIVRALSWVLEDDEEECK